MTTQTSTPTDTAIPGAEPEYRVVLNDEEQYSIWPADRDLPAGWKAEGTSGEKQVCLSRIEEVWVDMRPLSLRRRMAAAAAERPPAGH